MSTEPTSDNFDPLLALTSTSKPDENVKVYDNLAVFEAKLKRKDEVKAPKVSRQKEKSFSQQKRIAEEVRGRDVSKLKEMMETRRRMDEEGGKVVEKVEKPARQRKPPSTVFTIMEKLSVGPLSLLHRITKERLRCHVYTRHFDGLRGVLVGFVVVFDRYMNLAMVDVDETFMISPRGKVVDHQKKLSLAQLEIAMENIKVNGVDKSSEPETVPVHLNTTGVIKRKSTPASVTPPDHVTTAPTVKFYGNPHKPPPLTAQTFHGGNPQLYHRHINNLYVRGDSVALIQLPNS